MSAFSHQALADTLETEIRQNRLFDVSVDWQDEIIFPYYAGLSLRNIPHTIAAAFDVTLPHSSPIRADVWGDALNINEIDRVFVFLMDGMGYMHLNMLMADDEELRQAVADLTDGRGVMPLTSVAPTTTAVALPALWTGSSPAATGMLGTVMLMQEFSTLVNMLALQPARGKYTSDVLMDWGLTIDDVIAVPGLAEHLMQHDIETHMIIAKHLTGTGLSRVLHRGVRQIHKHTGNTSDMHLKLKDVLTKTRGQKSYIGLYWSAVDSIAHEFGAHNQYTHAEIRTQLMALRDILASPEVQDGRTLVMIAADHGHYDVSHKINLGDDALAAPLRQAMTVGLNGDNRLPQMHLRADKRQFVQDYIAEHYADSLATVPLDTVLEGGLFGAETHSPKTRSRLGDLTLIPRREWIVEDPSVGLLPLVSWHGGLSDWEMLIPLIWKVI